MAYALVISIALHIGAALVFIIAGNSRLAGDNSPSFFIQDIALTPSITAPKKLPFESPKPQSDIESKSSVPNMDEEKQAQNPATEHRLEPAVLPGKYEGMTSTPLGLGMTHGYFSSIADGKSLRDDIRAYYFDMVEKINREWWDKAGLLKEPLRQDGIFELVIQRDGTILSIRSLQGSGSREADRLLTEVIKNASPLPPLPTSYELGLFQAPLRIKAPSFLFRITN